ncbi:MAG: AAA family ATPase [Desulfobacteraceae bacterium]|nr:AAA family ATPase [Desulfobacteraceae bacterium]
MDILEWSSSRPAWQRDALRRLVTAGGLTESDLEELTALCKAAHGLAERRESAPLIERHIPRRGAGLHAVKLVTLTHHGGVNALAAEQRIQFGPALTIVYGANAAGKSGYTRILKRACRARGAEEILGNVLDGSAPGRPSATICFNVDDEEQELAWKGQDETHDVLGHVSVFDSHCAAVYLREKTDVAFRPFGLDLFDKLSDACEAVRRALEKERKGLAVRQVYLPDLPEGTAAHKLILSITSLTNPEEIKDFGTLSDIEKEQLKQVRNRFHDLKAKDPEKAAQMLSLRAQRLETLISNLTKLDEILANNAIYPLFDGRDAVQKARSVANELQATTFPSSLLKGTGSDIWRELWEAARRFSIDEAYPEGQFPITGDGVRCVLCQQDLRQDAAERLKRFEEFLHSTVQQKLDRVKADYQEQLGRLENLAVADEANQGALEELRIETEQLTKSIENGLEQARSRRDEVLKALREGQPVPEELPDYKLYAVKVATEAQVLHDRAVQLLQKSDQEVKDKLQKELRELEAREALGINLEAVLEEIERKKKLAAYEMCLKDTNTQGITRKSTEVTKRIVTQQLAKSFKDELERLHFTHLEVELQAVGGSRGALFHKLILTRAVGVNLPRVVSEGEARSLSIAAFFAELSTSSDQSAVLFDDPVSSLDHEWRENVAHRLAEEAKARQVIVFTHDIVFLLALVRWAEEIGAMYCHQYLRRGGLETGVSSPELPWLAMKVKDRIGALKNRCQRAEKLHRTATPEEYDREVTHIYGQLREAWERGLEEVLLGGVVELYRNSIQTQQAKHLSDITEDDCQVLEAGMTKCSRWLPGHDQAPAENVPIPYPEELRGDIEALENWRKTILTRRK